MIHDQAQFIKSYRFFTSLLALTVIKEIWLYGSRARGDYQEKSDIDLAILAPTATSNDWLVIMDIIEQADTLLKIDCVRFDALPHDSPLKANILADHLILFNRKEKELTNE